MTGHLRNQQTVMTSTQIDVAQDKNIEIDEDIDFIASEIIEKFNTIRPEMQQRRYIYRVSTKDREGYEKAYDPDMLSIGPYHRGKDGLQNAELHKRRVLKQVFERDGPKDVLMKRSLQELKGLEAEARALYGEIIPMEQGEFLEMLLLDGCFIIKFLSEWYLSADPLFELGWIKESLAYDLLLFENQLPFSVLVKLYGCLASSSGHQSVSRLCQQAATLPIFHFILASDQESEEQMSIMSHVNNHNSGAVPIEQDRLDGVKHLLDLVYKLLFIDETLLSPESSQIDVDQDDLEGWVSKNKPPATELRNAGIRFKAVRNKKFYDVKLENKTLKIPIVHITGKTERMLRNFVAHEASGALPDRKYVSDYVIFMDCLINTANDVELLRRQGIIKNSLGTDGAVSAMFNNIGRVSVASLHYPYAEIVNRLEVHCKRKRNVWNRAFESQYLSSPWAITSLIAAFVFLALTAIQAVYSALSFHLRP